MNKNLLFTTLLIILFQSSCNAFSLPGNGDTPATVTLVATQSENVPEQSEETQTPLEISTETAITPSQTATYTEEVPDMEEEPDVSFLFDKQTGTPVLMQALTHDCNWMGVAGQVFDQEEAPVTGLVIEAGGVIDGQPILGLALTSLNETYGPGGYEMKLLDSVIESTASLWVQVKDADGNPLSPQVLLDTVADCDQNLILVNFVAQQVIPENLLFIPIVKP